MNTEYRMNIPELFSLQERVAIVTGAYEWLGNDVASVFAEAGASVIITSRSLEKAQEAADRLQQQYGIDTLGLAMDQRRYEEVAAMARQAFAWKGKMIFWSTTPGAEWATVRDIYSSDPPKTLPL